MGFIEELARRRQFAERQRLEERSLRNRREEAKAEQVALEERRRFEAKQAAIQSSVVPEMADRLQVAAGVVPEWVVRERRSVLGSDKFGSHKLASNLLASNVSADIVVGELGHPGRRDGSDWRVTKSFIHIEGMEDGSVVIGRTRLNATQARDPQLVDQALGKAYNSAERREFRLYDLEHPSIPGPS